MTRMKKKFTKLVVLDPDDNIFEVIFVFDFLAVVLAVFALVCVVFFHAVFVVLVFVRFCSCSCRCCFCF